MESEITFILNQETILTKENPSTVLLDFIRKEKKLTGTKEVCKEGDCGACAILLGEVILGELKYSVINSCLFPIIKVEGKHVVTIEGLNQSDLTPIQNEFFDEGASQCGFCTPGFIIAFTSYLLNSEKFDLDEAENSIAGNICRCTGYHSIKRAINNVGNKLEKLDLQSLTNNKIIPDYFANIKSRLSELQSKSEDIHRSSEQQIISGGTDLFVQRPDELLNKKIVSSERIAHSDIFINDNKIIIGGSATVTQFKSFVSNDKLNISFEKLFSLFASLPIRNSATLAGNIVNASPIADLTITLIALNSVLVLENVDKTERMVALKDFYSGYKTLNKDADEIIKEIYFDLPSKNVVFNFEKVSKRTFLDIASVNTAICIEAVENKIGQCSISAGGVSPIPLKLSGASKFLEGANVSTNTILEMIEVAKTEISPISDIRGSKEYKTLLLEQLLKAHFIELFPSLLNTEELL